VRERAREQREILQDQRARLRQQRELEQDARRYLMQFQELKSVRKCCVNPGSDLKFDDFVPFVAQIGGPDIPAPGEEMQPHKGDENSLLPKLPADLHAALLKNIKGAHACARPSDVYVCAVITHPTCRHTAESQMYQQEQLMQVVNRACHLALSPYPAPSS
jgi:hypothetical protein